MDKPMMMQEVETPGEVDLVKNVEEADYYPAASKQYPNARKYMTYESISTGVGGKK
jgi:hypothetical protein